MDWSAERASSGRPVIQLSRSSMCRTVITEYGINNFMAYGSEGLRLQRTPLQIFQFFIVYFSLKVSLKLCFSKIIKVIFIILY